jgi:hypothetical protein
MRRAQGNYASSDMTRFEQDPMGKVIFYFRKFLVPMFLNRFGYARPNWEAGQMAIGYWRAVVKSFKYYGAGETTKQFLSGSNRLSKTQQMGNTILKEDNSTVDLETNSDDKKMMSEFFMRSISQAKRDAVAMGILSVLGMIAISYIRQKDDDDEELDIITGNAFRIFWGVKGETLAMFPIGGGSDEYIRNFTTAIPFLREATKLKNMVDHGWSAGLAMIINAGGEPHDGDSKYYHELYKDGFYTKKSGPYEKGTVKLYKDLIDLTGARNIRDLFTPEVRIDQLKRSQ